MKRIILSILSVFITLGAAAETGQALPAVQRAATAAVEETPSGKEGSVPPETSDTPGTGTEATTETTSGLAAETDTATAAGTLGTLGAPAAPSAPMPAAMPAEKHKRPQVERFLPTRRRIDREINKLKFAYKGEVMMGLTASYGTVSSDDTDLMLIFDNIDADATIATVKPFVGYFYRDNNCIGIRFGTLQREQKFVAGPHARQHLFRCGRGQRPLGAAPLRRSFERRILIWHFPPFLCGARPQRTLRALRRVRAGALDGTFELRIRPGS